MSESTDDSVCEAFQLHPRRKVCKECKHPRDRHPLREEDIRQIQNILTSLAKDCGAEDLKSNSVYAWIPPRCPEERLEDYFNCFLDSEVPKHSSEGLQWHLKTLMKQIPETDISASACRFIDPENLPNFEEFVEDIRKEKIHFGYVKPRTEEMPFQCPTCLILLEVNELVVVPAKKSSLAYHPACFICSICKEHLVDLVNCFEVDGKIYCVRHYSETLFKRCSACDELIFAGRYTQTGEAFYHIDHLRCFQCDDRLDSKKVYDQDGELYCLACYEEMFGDDCQKCGQRISLDSRHLTYQGKFWHYNCFTCDKCGEIITEFEDVDGKFYCMRCFTDHIAPRCVKCKQIIDTAKEYATYEGKDFHINCFKCDDCGKNIGATTFLTHGGLAYCKECHVRNFAVRCFKCRYPITDEEGVMYNKQPYHDKCFTCHRCQTRLAGQKFKNVDDDIYCVHCYGETFCRKCHSCGQPILIGDNDVLYSYGDFKWHSDCFICRVCNRSLADTPFTIQENTLICKGCASQEDTFSAASTSRGLEHRRPTERISRSSRDKVPARKSSSNNRKKQSEKSEENQRKKS
ncbi:Four and a half LIM domains protein 3 [Araneus ventricosus]|uniref:Four and a half LIM domains protein 3 n=1 Tax=Araneus ventricosus TaxID=182803 RepID=A0A4Y2A909_ARAVE|nr:Four and a half LIM domains protein 3 [Araneus ventricosus]